MTFSFSPCQILASTVNGTTYCGIRARTTGAPQNHWCACAHCIIALHWDTKEALLLLLTHSHWSFPHNTRFGPCGDPRGAGIGTPEAIRLVWSGHREVIYDEGPIPQNWKTPAAT